MSGELIILLFVFYVLYASKVFLYFLLNLCQLKFNVTYALHFLHDRGLGVGGEQPAILPRTSFEYSSGCPLSTQNGRMVKSFFLFILYEVRYCCFGQLSILGYLTEAGAHITIIICIINRSCFGQKKAKVKV